MSKPKESSYTYIDKVADVLKRLSKKDKVKPEEVTIAIQQYNDLIGDLKFYKDELDKQKNGRTEQRLESEKKDKDKEISRLKEEINELKQRLSSVMGQQIKAGNPDIADLSDQNRPTKLAEIFKSLYDDEWTSAFEEMEKTGKITSEEAMIEILTDIVKTADKFCETASNQHISTMMAILKHDMCNPKVTENKSVLVGDTSVMDEQQERKLVKILIDTRKEFAELSVRPLGKIFYESHLKKILKNKRLPETSQKMNEFVAQLLRIIWLMKVQDPPICLAWQKPGEPINRDWFTFYTKRGDSVSYCVWPAVFLHQDGPLMSKGVLQAK